MRLYVVRHGEAEAQRTTDEARALTVAGRDGVRQLWRQLVAEGIRPATLISSPYVRARQTAEEIAGECGLTPGAPCELLVPDGHPQRVFEWLLARDDQGPLVLVSHMPLVGHLVGQLSEGPGARLPMGVGAVAALEVEVPAIAGARLLWLRAPGDLFQP
ncbi:MAG: phosphohistidine phosphatase SixA [Alcanivorax sp.]|nr:phosphohistidine phosphatase SixA [Alcanivorax sp.]